MSACVALLPDATSVSISVSPVLLVDARVLCALTFGRPSLFDALGRLAALDALDAQAVHGRMEAHGCPVTPQPVTPPLLPGTPPPPPLVDIDWMGGMDGPLLVEHEYSTR